MWTYVEVMEEKLPLWEAPGRVSPRRNRELSLLCDLSGDCEAWLSTGLYLLEGQSAEVSLSEAAASAGLKVRQTLGTRTTPNIAKTLPHHRVVYLSLL